MKNLILKMNIFSICSFLRRFNFIKYMYNNYDRLFCLDYDLVILSFFVDKVIMC